jgi:diacylglycerol kinase (ATP)
VPARRSGSLAGRAGVRALRGTEFEVVPRYPRPVSADGEVVTTTPARFSVVPKALAVYVPAPTPA